MRHDTSTSGDPLPVDFKCKIGGDWSIRRTEHHTSEGVRLQSSYIVLPLELAEVADDPFFVCVVSEALEVH